MREFRRYAIYYLPPEGAFAAFGAAWLGWDALTGSAVAHPDLDGLPAEVSALTDTPRRYGFHGTVKPPFALADGSTPGALAKDARAMAARLAPVAMTGLKIAVLGRFLALIPEGDTEDLRALAAKTVEALDHHRAAAGEAELARRRAKGLSPAQEANLTRWGYPYVMDEFRFHMTLTGQVPEAADRDAIARALTPELAPLLPKPFTLDTLSLAGEDDQGRFHLIERLPLGTERDR